MMQIKNLGRYVHVADELLFGRDEDLRVTEVKTDEAVEYSSIMPSPHVLAQHMLSTGYAPKERVKKLSLVEVKAQNTAGENFWRTYRFSDAGRAAGFAQTMRDYQERGGTIHVHMHNRRNRLPWYLPHII